MNPRRDVRAFGHLLGRGAASPELRLLRLLFARPPLQSGPLDGYWSRGTGGPSAAPAPAARRCIGGSAWRVVGWRVARRPERFGKHRVDPNAVSGTRSFPRAHAGANKVLLLLRVLRQEAREVVAFLGRTGGVRVGARLRCAASTQRTPRLRFSYHWVCQCHQPRPHRRARSAPSTPPLDGAVLAPSPRPPRPPPLLPSSPPRRGPPLLVLTSSSLSASAARGRRPMRTWTAPAQCNGPWNAPPQPAACWTAS